MKEYLIGPGEEGIKLYKQLVKILDNAGSAFIYKMLRKKNITLNDKKATGSEHLIAGDVIKIYLSDETFRKFSSGVRPGKLGGLSDLEKKYNIKDMIVHEDDDILILNKPPGLLSQKAQARDVSINELCLDYLYRKGEITDASMKIFKPSVCNRLDRNTSGLMVFAKNYKAASLFAAALKDRTIYKYYLCIVKGRIDKEGVAAAYLEKDKKLNTVRISDVKTDGAGGIRTAYRPLAYNYEYSLLEVDLITGRSHQIRAQMAHLKHPLLGDSKYGDERLNVMLRSCYKINRQVLHAYKLVVPSYEDNDISGYAGTYLAPVPGDMEALIRELFDMDVKDIV